MALSTLSKVALSLLIGGSAVLVIGGVWIVVWTIGYTGFPPIDMEAQFPTPYGPLVVVAIGIALVLTGFVVAVIYRRRGGLPVKVARRRTRM